MTPIYLPLKTGRGLNAREHHFTRARRVKNERMETWVALRGRRKPALPCSVLLTRCAPSGGLDDDNLSGSLKGVRDQVAEWLGVDDKDRETVRYHYAQKRAPWGVLIEFREPGATLTES